MSARPPRLELGGLGLDRGGHLLVKHALRALPLGAALEVVGDDPHLRVHLQTWARQQGLDWAAILSSGAISTSSSESGTASMVTDDPRAKHVAVRRGYLIVDLVDGRQVRVPVSWFPRLAQATQAERDQWELLDDGRGIRWPPIDEDLSVSGLLNGRRGSSKRAS